ncbi:uncharacterized protein LOC119670839 [Teleopsis dalmanni]|uniref:uncharacterized protein LOC119670839 n=1 Tax=Teleopsis dalmanni TaxID=139649 RepID=UPI0018CCE735|nr:uncharacterized protein LOC119670839 [Teleopsis dalmanni]
MESEQKNLSESSIRLEKVLLSNSTNAKLIYNVSQEFDVKSTKNSIVLNKKETEISERNESESIVLDKEETKISEKRDTESIKINNEGRPISEKRDTERIELNNEETDISEKKDTELMTDKESLAEILRQTKTETETDDIFQGKHFSKDDLPCQREMENTAKSSSHLNKTEINTMKKLTKKKKQNQIIYFQKNQQPLG